jgi:DNA adenine methylase
MKTMIPWVGGARLLVAELLRRFPKHTCYVEVFAGSARMLFEKPRDMSRVEVINDADDDLINLFSVVKDRKGFRGFIKGLSWLLTSRTQFERFRRLEISDLTPVQQALRTFYLLKVGFGGKLNRPCFAYSARQKSRLNIDAIVQTLRAIHRRLSQVYIENLDFEDCIKKYDRRETFFYCAPPHYGLRNHRFSMNEKDHIRLQRVLGGIKGSYLLTYNDHPEIHKLYKGFIAEKVMSRYCIGQQATGKWDRSRILMITSAPCG